MKQCPDKDCDWGKFGVIPQDHYNYCPICGLKLVEKNNEVEDGIQTL